MRIRQLAVIIFTMLLQLLMEQGFAQKAFALKGTFTNAPENGRVFLYYMGGNKRPDTTSIHSGTFRINGQLDTPIQAILLIKQKAADPSPKGKMQSRMLCIDPGETIIQGADLKTATITGGPTQASLAGLMKKWAATGWTREGKNTEEVLWNKNEATLAFAHGHPNSMVAFWAIEQLATATYLAGHQKRVQEVFDKMDPTWQAGKAGQKIARMLKTARLLGVGEIAPDFASPDTAGHHVSLADFRGKYVLLDFWASWCGPCRAENPNVVKNYNKYKEKNFTVLGVSLDGQVSKQKWLDAIHKDGLTWTQVSDLQGWKNAVAAAYQVQSIPINYLIGPDGKIVAVGLRGDALGEKLAALLDK